MRVVRVARQLRRDALLAHHTATLPGVAALPERPLALQRLQRFKQRRGPFLLLISPRLASRIRVRGWLLWRSRRARAWMRRAWSPQAATTLLLPASRRAPAAAVHRGRIALRMVTDQATSRLLSRCGGALFSSSLNRRGGEPQMVTARQRWRWRRYRMARLAGVEGSGSASSLLDLCGSCERILR